MDYFFYVMGVSLGFVALVLLIDWVMERRDRS
jgi:preprotein translocase subunit SecE